MTAVPFRKVTVCSLVLYSYSLTLYILFQHLMSPPPCSPPVPSTTCKKVTNPDVTHIDYLLNAADVCADFTASITAVFLVTSYAGNFEARAAIREAYPAEELKVLGVRRVFLLAWVNNSLLQTLYNNNVAQKDVVEESHLHDDIVQVDMTEDYHNLTYKNLMGHKWVGQHCSHAEFMVKMDDDVMMDVWQLLEVIRGLNETEREMIVGYIDRSTPSVSRNTSLEFHYVSVEEYPYCTYPVYAYGMLYLFTPRNAARILVAAKSVAYLWKDDAYITGVLAEHVGILHKDVRERFTVDRQMLCCENTILNERYMCRKVIALVTGHGQDGDYSIMKKVKEHAQRCHEQDCKPLPANAIILLVSRNSTGIV